MVAPIELKKDMAESFNLSQIADTLECEEAFFASRRTAASLAKGDDLRFILTVMMKGETPWQMRV